MGFINDCGQSCAVEEKLSSGAMILPTHTARLFREAVVRAAELLRAGEVVALPTETVYGLAANALNPDAVENIFRIKGRPAHNPIIVHVADAAMIKQCVSEWPPEAERLAKAFWPGPLTLVAPCAAEIPTRVTAGGRTVGVRWPSHPFIQAVIRECGFPLAAPSANPSNLISPTNAEHVRKHLGKQLRLIIDGGQSQVGIESTVVDVSVTPPRVLRPGMIHKQALLAVIGQFSEAHDQVSDILKSPGQLLKHYAPRAKLAILPWKDEGELDGWCAGTAINRAKTHIIAHTRIPSGERFGRVSVIPHDAEAFARAIYAELHECDEAGAELIVVEALPESSEWVAIADRLRRAAAS